MALRFGNPQVAPNQWQFGDPTDSSPVPFAGTAAPSTLRLLAVCAGAARDAGGFLENDTDEFGNPFSYTLVSGVSNGTLTTYLGGAFEYTPNPGFVGFDAFTYRAHAGCAAGNVATVTLSVEGQFTGTAAAATLALLGNLAVPAFGFTPVAASAAVAIQAPNPVSSFGQNFDGTASFAALGVFAPAAAAVLGFDAAGVTALLRAGADTPTLAAGYAMTPISAQVRVAAAPGLLDLGGAAPTIVYHPLTARMTDREYLK